MKNPFEFGRELSADELVDRHDEVEEVRDAIRDAGKLFLIGPRRYGKTSILRVAAEKSQRIDRAIVLRYDVQAFPLLEDLASRLLTDTAHALAPSFDKAGKMLRKFFSNLQPRLDYDPTENTFSASLGQRREKESSVPLLTDVLDGIELAAARAKRPVAVILDEFQKVVEDGGEEAEGQIRAAIQRHRHVAYVFAGSKTRLLADMVGNEGRPFYKLGKVRFLGPVPRDEFAAFLSEGFRRGGISTTEDAIETLLDAGEEVPYNVQALAHACWDGLHETGRRTTLTTENVLAMRDTIALRADPFYTMLWNGLTTPQQKTLLAVLREEDHGLASTAVSKRYGVPVSTIQKSLSLLEDKNILREDQRLGTARLRLEDPFFGAWINLVIPR